MTSQAMKIFREQNLIEESVKKDAKILYDEKEVGFGDPMHIADLKQTIQGMIRLRDILTPGSAFRNVTSETIKRARKLLDKCEAMAVKQQAELHTVEKRALS